MQYIDKQHGQQFRLMQAEDLDAVSKLVSEAGPHPWSRSDVQSSYASALDQCWLLCDTGSQQIIGYAVLHAVLDECQLLNICIDHAFQGRGHGSRFLQFLLDYARTSGLRTIFLEVRDSNHGAIALYEKAGFGQINLRTRYYPASAGTREDARVYSLSLS